MEPIYSAEELAAVHAYAGPIYAWAAIRIPLSVAVSLAVLRFAVRPMFARSVTTAAWMNQRLASARTALVIRAVPAALDRMWNGAGWGAALLFALANFLLVNLLFLPKDVYFDYFHAHAHGLSNYTPASYVYDVVKALVLGSIMAALLAFGLYGLARRLRRWWLVLGIVAGSGMLFASAIDPYRSQIWFDREPLAKGPLRSEITALMSRANVTFSDVVVEKTSRVSKELQAYFAGQGPTQTIVLNDVLVQSLSTDEALAAVAHEAGHINESKWPRRVLSAFGLMAFLYLLHRLLILAARRQWFGATEYADIRTLPMLYFALSVVMMVSAPLSGAWSRMNETRADTYALELTGDPDAFKRMLVKAARLNKLDPEPPGFIKLLGMTHPPIGERLRHVATLEKKQTAGGSGLSPSPIP